MADPILTDSAKAIAALQRYVGRVNQEHGFREYTDRALDADAMQRAQANAMMLIVGEVAEAHEELRSGRAADETYYPVPAAIAKPEGVPSEIADVVIRCLDFADNFGFDLGAIIAEKIAYNETRPYKHGRNF